jgi:uncharacterized protein YecT (DUF1311 family)
MMRTAVLFAFLLGIASGEFACAGESADIAAVKHERCEMAGRNMEMTMCMGRELKESDARLNLVYGTLVKALARPQSLQQVQRTWIAFRDAECKFQNEAMEGGSGYRFAMDLCLTNITEQRIAELERVQPCNGCVEFKPAFYGSKGYQLPPRAAFTMPQQE